ncbi:glycoside hydrolase family 10 protein [Paenibacillus cymbidii]|uniref:hypothetical protein n=1 Tax=Paenibacillus cymbidii TaxID=1639034 RepID=UPI0010807B3B|nr:hypothetical protein [Paenibacillus cymbidii]
MAGLCLNEDNNHFYHSRRDREVSRADVEALVDQYGDTQVNEFLVNVNAMRTVFDSRVWDSFWTGYEPEAGDDQPLFRSLPAESRAVTRAWIHRAWKMKQDGLDFCGILLERAREKGMSPWVSVRMNDVHCVDDESHPLIAGFWRDRPELRRVRHRFAAWTDKAFDFGLADVREHHYRLIEEVAERYDFDGLELDWMRFAFHFRPGEEEEGRAHLSAFVRRVRELLDRKGAERGVRIKLGCRVPSRPQTAFDLGMDAVRWARDGLVDMLVPTPFWETSETDMPIELWKQLLEGTGVLLAAGLELLIRAYPASPLRQTNTLETVRGAAISYLSRGADRVYLFNYMDDHTAISDLHHYPALLREAGELATLRGKPRRHVLTYADTWAPGEPHAAALPIELADGRQREVRIPLGPKPELGERASVIVAAEWRGGNGQLRIYANGEACGAGIAVELPSPKPDGAVYAYAVPAGALKNGYQLVDLQCIAEEGPASATIHWVELRLERQGEAASGE